MKEWILFNGSRIEKGTAIVSSESRGFKYGDGCFETIKMVKGQVKLKELHFERLFSSLRLLGFEVGTTFTPAYLLNQAASLAKENKLYGSVRIRLSVFSGNGNLTSATGAVNWVMEALPIDESVGKYNKEGLRIDIYKDARKTRDSFSHIKSNSFLPYIVAARWAKSQSLDDAILLNNFDNIADTTIANLFIVKDGIIKTPSLNQGGIAGVMRRYLVLSCKKEGLPIAECPLTISDLENASEVFLTNAVRGIRWVHQAGKHHYLNKVSLMLHDKFLQE